MHAQDLQGQLLSEDDCKVIASQSSAAHHANGSTRFHSAHLLIHQCSDRQTVEAVCENLPQPHIVTPLALIVESVYPVDRCALVVPTKQEKILWILDLHKSAIKTCRLLAHHLHPAIALHARS